MPESSTSSNQPGCRQELSIRQASALLISRRQREQDAKIQKIWAVTEYLQAKDRLRRAIEKHRDTEMAFTGAVNLIERAGFVVALEDPSKGVYMPYVLKINGATLVFSVNGGREIAQVVE